MKKIVFDLCWTLYKANTTFDFVRFVTNKYTSRKVYIRIVDVFKVLLVLFGNLIKVDLYRICYIFSLRGLSESDVIHLAEKYVEQIGCKMIPEIHSLMNEMKATEDFFIIICSASIDPVVNAVSKLLRVDSYLATTLTVSDGHYTGAIKRDLLGEKVNYVENPYWVITDNKSDLNLIRIATKHTIVSNLKDVAYWKNNGYTPDYII